MISLFPKALLDPNAEAQVTRDKARTCLVVNLVAFPGLGTAMAGRRIGIAQIMLVLAGVCMILGFAALYFNSVMKVVLDPLTTEADWWSALRAYAWLGISGFAISVVAWVWSLISGLSILRAAKERERKPPLPPLEP